MKVSSNLRRHFLASSATTLTAGALSGSVVAQQPLTTATATPTERPWPQFRYCLNTSTINGGEVPVRQQLQIAAEAGYDAVELWLRDVAKFLEQGGRLSDLSKEIADLGLGLDSAIAFGSWITDDPQQRADGLQQCRRDMEMVRDLGGKRIAAPPVGATQAPQLELPVAAERYRRLLELGTECDVTPQLELWGFSLNLSTLAEVLYVAAAANHPQACLLLDVYHMYKGGSDFTNIGFVPGTKLHCLHMNDYPASPSQADIKDADRVYPGDGVAPIGEILKALVASGFAGTLSLELFNRDYWKLPPLEVAQTGLQKMKAVAEL